MRIEKAAAWIWAVIGGAVIIFACICGIHELHLHRIMAIRASCHEAQGDLDGLRALKDAKAAGVQFSEAERAVDSDLEKEGKVKLSHRLDECFERLAVAEKSFL